MVRKSAPDLTHGPLASQILLFSLPLILSNLLQVLFNLSDVAVVGRFAGSGALGSVGSTTTLVALFTGFVMGMGSGVNVIVARFAGAKDDEKLSASVAAAGPLCLAVGVFIALLGILSLRSVLTLMNTKEELYDGALLYLRIYLLGMPALAVYNWGHAVFSAVGDTRTPLIVLSSAGAFNVALNLLFVLVCRLDVAGVALASVISQVLSAVVLTVLLMRQKGAHRFDVKKLTFGGEYAKMILPIGVMTGFQYAIFQIANLFIQTGVNSFDALTVSGNSAAMNADALVYNTMAAFYTACGSFVSQNLGAGNRKRVIRSYYISIGYAFGIAALIGLLLRVFKMPFLMLFTSETVVASAGIPRLTVMSWSYCVSAFMDGTIAASRGLGKSAFPTFFVIMGSCVFRIIWIMTIFAYFRTIASLYLLYVFSWSLTAAAEIAYFFHIWKKIRETLPETVSE